MLKSLVFSISFCLMSLACAEEFEIDLDLGEEINEVCAGCHGEYGEGGKGGEYPRLAGLPAGYIAQQLKLFKEEKRKNMPMRPYANERELPVEDVPSIAAYLSQIQLTSKMPEFDEGISAYEKLLIAKKVFNIPRAEGDVARGKKIYKDECKSCHGRKGKGKKKSITPQLTGQYTRYMLKQMKHIIQGERWHEYREDFQEMTAEEIQDVMAYLSIMDD